jgi:hypothetical protein
VQLSNVLPVIQVDEKPHNYTNSSGLLRFLIHTAKTALQRGISARHWWCTSVILATQQAEIRRIVARSQPGQTVHKNLS